MPMAARSLASYGGWLTVTHVVGPLMGFMDRFFIGALISLTAVAHYATPWEVVTRLLIVSGALLNVLFPALAAAWLSDRARASELHRRSNRYVLLGLFPAVLPVLLFAEPALAYWLDAEFAAASAPIAQVLALGVLLNASGAVASTVIAAAGRPDLSARLHLLELPLYLLALYLLIGRFGALGAAIAWSARVALDALALQWLAARLFGQSTGTGLRAWAGLVGLALLLLLPGLLLHGGARMGYAVIVLIAYAGLVWRWLLAPEERAWLRALRPGVS